MKRRPRWAQGSPGIAAIAVQFRDARLPEHVSWGYLGEFALEPPKQSSYSKAKRASAQRKTLVPVVSCKRYASWIGDLSQAPDAAP